MGYTLNATTTLPFDAALEKTREALADENFGVLSEIDVQATLKAKLGVDREPPDGRGAEEIARVEEQRRRPPARHRAGEARAQALEG